MYFTRICQSSKSHPAAMLSISNWTQAASRIPLLLHSASIQLNLAAARLRLTVELMLRNHQPHVPGPPLTPRLPYRSDYNQLIAVLLCARYALTPSMSLVIQPCNLKSAVFRARSSIVPTYPVEITRLSFHLFIIYKAFPRTHLPICISPRPHSPGVKSSHRKTGNP